MTAPDIVRIPAGRSTRARLSLLAALVLLLPACAKKMGSDVSAPPAEEAPYAQQEAAEGGGADTHLIRRAAARRRGQALVIEVRHEPPRDAKSLRRRRLARGLRRGGLLILACRCGHNKASELPQIGKARGLPLKEDVAEVRLVAHAADEVEPLQRVEGAGDGGLGDVQVLGKAAHRVRAGRDTDGHQDRLLAGGEIRRLGADRSGHGPAPEFKPVAFRQFHASSLPEAVFWKNLS